MARALDYEWLETNGRGGFASGTVAGANTRRYHALLLVARRPPVDRVVLVNQVEDWVTVGDARTSLATNLYSGAVHPEGYRACEGFVLDPWPIWSFEVCGVRLLREILCVRGRDLVIVRWRRVDTLPVPVMLSVRPKLSGRDYHSLHRENQTLQPDAETAPGRVTWHPYHDIPPVRAHHNGRYRHQDEWFRCIQLPAEQSRGLDGEEDWWSPGEFTWTLSSGNSAILVFTTEDEPVDAIRWIDEERARRSRLESSAPGMDRLARRLWTAAETYISQRGEQQTVLAGYPWFTDWGRDTFISLPGLCLVAGRHDVARQIIRTFASHVSEGMIPNRFPDQGEKPDYNTIDASLWFVHTVGRYLDLSSDDEFLYNVAWPAVKQIIDGYRRGTRYGIRLDQDGLITGGELGVQLTWMDAKVGDWVVTPRHGKPVEVQALWTRSLEVAEALARRFGDPTEAERYRADRLRARLAFQARFWYQEGGYLYDVVDGPQGNDSTLRPNQLYAISLARGLLTFEQAHQVLEIVRAKLLTPVGLRTLSPDHPDYRGIYQGGAWERDGAYHQGTVWPFLLGAFVTAWIKTYGASREVQLEARKFLEGLDAHLEQAGLGQVSEIFDAEPPHTAKGCIAQAWSVAEPLRVLLEDLIDVSEPFSSSDSHNHA
ncbi:glycogen debranching protein [Nitrospira sp.]|nr:glycogen debranching protein [Nitrospira sp.]